MRAGLGPSNREADKVKDRDDLDAMKFPGQGSDLSPSCYLHYNCDNAGSCNPLYWAWDQTCILGTAETPLTPLRSVGTTKSVL